jgi:microsomal dipeptidase-like Zn-dependent dipeptidase
MRVLADRSPAAIDERRDCAGRWFWLDGPRCFVMLLAARMFNFKSPCAGWRVTFGGLQAARAGLVLSVLYDPAPELLVKPGRQMPRPGAFDGLLCQLECVEAELLRADPQHLSHNVVKSRAELERTLDAGRIALVHCVEGGFHIGDNETDIKCNVASLADEGIAYITVAHLFYRGIASNSCALPWLSDEAYDFIFRQREHGLSDLGRAVVSAMYEHGMLIDITHMDALALEATFALLEDLDNGIGTEKRSKPKEHPVIASHAGYRFDKLDYMLDDGTIEQIAERGGVIGLILAKHQLEDGFTRRQRRASRFHALDCHIKQIYDITGSHAYACIGSDHDGFIKPTVSRIHRSEDLVAIERWLRRDYPSDVADAILYGNAERVVTGALPAERRAGARGVWR